MLHRSSVGFVSGILAVSLLLATWTANAGAQDASQIKPCDLPDAECATKVCNIMCKQGTTCIPCGCSLTCTSTSAILQKPLHMCADGELAQTCDLLSSVKPGTTCGQLLQQGPCKPGYTCREYLCSSGCIAKCVPDDTGNITTPSINPPPAWPPADWSYYCLDGSPAQKCDIPVSDSKDSCDKLGCGASDPTSPILPPEKLICAPWKCGASDTAVCQKTCARDVSFSVPPPLPAGPVCPDKTTIADWCSTGAKQEDVDAQCWQLGCEKDGVMCGEFRCGDTMADGGKQCGVTCVTEAYHKPYMCPGSDRAGRKCNPPMDVAPVCNPPCNGLDEFCAPLYCGDGCKYQCLKNPWYTPPSHMCPTTGIIAPECKAVASDDAACKAKGCGEGQMCRYLDCGAGCQAQCVNDPNYIAPQPSPFLCPADNSTAMQCFSSDGAAACTTMVEGAQPALVCPDGSLCGEFQCGGSGCKAMCVLDPYYRPYLCPVTGTVAKKCDPGPPDSNYACTEDCVAKGPEYFCAPFECDGKCAPICMKSPWYEPPTYLCDEFGAYIAKECTPSESGAGCAAMSCAAGYKCGAYECTSDGGTGGGGVVPIRGRRLAGNFDGDVSCKYRCVKDPTYVPPPVYKCTSGEIATPCGPYGDKPGGIIPMGPSSPGPKLRSVTNRRQSVTKVTGDMMWAPVCDPECTEPGYFCMQASCGVSATCGATCVKDDNYVPPPPPPTLCADSYNFATLCKAAIDDATCQSLQCAEKGFTCAAADCNDGSGCTTRCVTQGYFFPGIPTTPLVYSCKDGSVAKPCSFEPLPGQATCNDNITCDGGMMCGDYECGGTCGPMCVPLPPPTMFPIFDEVGGGGGGVNSPCPRGAQVQQCKANMCATTKCADAEVCYQSPCNCQAVCVSTKKYKGPVNLGTVKEGKTGGSTALRGERVRKCVKGTAVAPRTCAGDPCDEKKCDPATQKCVREFCGGCLAACVPKDSCPNKVERRGCISTANFCMTVKCGYNQTCLPNQCNDCKARCFGPCGPGRYASRTTAQCEKCPRGFACGGFGSKDPDPVPCNDGWYAPAMGMRKCKKCPKGQTTPKNPRSKGHFKCNL